MGGKKPVPVVHFDNAVVRKGISVRRGDTFFAKSDRSIFRVLCFIRLGLSFIAVKPCANGCPPENTLEIAPQDCEDRNNDER